MHKQEVRRFVKTLKRQFTPEQLCDMSRPVTHRLLTNPAVVAAKVVLLYYSLPDEVCTHEVIDTLRKKGKTVLLPVVTGQDTMELRTYNGKDCMQTGAFGILEPTGEPFTDETAIDVAVVPGVAFDTRGNRLGRGRGYYDRLLKRLTHTYKIGMCFDFQKLPGVPVHDNDVAMDMVV